MVQKVLDLREYTFSAKYLKKLFFNEDSRKKVPTILVLSPIGLINFAFVLMHCDTRIKRVEVDMPNQGLQFEFPVNIIKKSRKDTGPKSDSLDPSAYRLLYRLADKVNSVMGSDVQTGGLYAYFIWPLIDALKKEGYQLEGMYTPYEKRTYNPIYDILIPNGGYKGVHPISDGRSL